MANRYENQERRRTEQEHDWYDDPAGESNQQINNDWNRTHQWLVRQEKYRDQKAFNDPYRQRSRLDWDYGYGYDPHDPARADNDWNDESYRDQVYREYGERARYGPSYGDFSGVAAYPSAGMGADFGEQFDYEQRDPDDPGLDYRRGDIGYESEGAFYQDLDEPVNARINRAWNAPGSFTGIGPRNYRRSDQRIMEDVCERLSQHGRIDARNIEVDVTGGEVTLRGSVPTREMKRMAEDAADLVSGVIDIQNRIKIMQA